MSMSASNMASEIVVSIATLSDDDKKDQSKVMEKMCQAIITHIITNMEVSGIKTTLDSSLNTIFSAGVPIANDGGAALQTAWKAATAAGAKDDATQNNDGTGRIS